MAIHGLPGGGIYALTTSEVYIDLTALAGHEIVLSCPGDWQLCFAPVGTAAGSLVTAATPADLVTFIADQVGGTIKVQRYVHVKYTVLVAKVLTGSGNLTIKRTGKVG